MAENKNEAIEKNENQSERLSMTSVHADRIKPAKSNPNLSIVRTELPADIAKDAKFATGFVAVPNFNVHMPQNGKYATVTLGEADKPVNVQYTDKNDERQTAQVNVEDLVNAHQEATKAYRAQRTAEVAADVKEPVAEAEVEAEA